MKNQEFLYSENTSRQSNLELLRCVLMLMLLVLHFNGIALKYPTTLGELNNNYICGMSQLGIESLTVIVVNCFVLISGYFGVKINIRKVVSLYLECLFYSMIALLVLHPLQDITLKQIVFSFLVFSNSPLWFITCYVGLFLFAPILNKALMNISLKEHLYFIILLTILNCYLGWLWKAEMNTIGYSTMQFIYIYIIGRFLKKLDLNNIKKRRLWLVVGYIVLSSLNFLMAYVCIKVGWGQHTDLHAFSYNNPLIILSSCLFMILFTTFNIQSYWINWVAKSSLAVYIFHIYFWDIIRNEIVTQASELSIHSFLLWAISAICIIYVLAILVDKIRIFVMQPIEKLILFFIAKTSNYSFRGY